ncbi:MAG: hypothetical protein ABWW65_03520 [Thermoprotei archaeon]
MPRRKKKETYYQRWRREHPSITIYFNKEEYEWIKREAEERGMTVKELLLTAIRKKYRLFRKGLLEGLHIALDFFIDSPHTFHFLLRRRAEVRGLKNLEVALFTIPCCVCGEPVLITHKDEEWKEIKAKLYRAFSLWGHAECIRKTKRTRQSRKY